MSVACRDDLRTPRRAAPLHAQVSCPLHCLHLSTGQEPVCVGVQSPPRLDRCGLHEIATQQRHYHTEGAMHKTAGCRSVASLWLLQSATL